MIALGIAITSLIFACYAITMIIDITRIINSRK